MTTDNITLPRALIEQLVGALQGAENVILFGLGYKQSAIESHMTKVRAALAAGREALVQMQGEAKSIKLMRDCFNLLGEFEYTEDEDSLSKSFFKAHINEDWFFYVKNSLERLIAHPQASEPAPSAVVETAIDFPFYELKFILRVLGYHGTAPKQDWITAHGMAMQVFNHWHSDALLQAPADTQARPVAPQPVQDLTTDELNQLWFDTFAVGNPTAGNAHIRFARAVLKKARGE